jgi:hypothetical protein
MEKWRQPHVFLTSALDGGELSVLRLGRFSAGERAAIVHWVGSWVVPGAIMDP